MFENIYLTLVAAAPSLVAIFTSIAAAVKIIKGFADLKAEVVSTKEMAEIKKELAAVHRENAELKKTLNETLTKIDRVKRD